MSISLQDTNTAFPQGQIIGLEPSLHYGLIESVDGRNVYFHQDSVIGVDFTSLGIGDRVRFNEAANQPEPQATTVFLANRGKPVEW